ncbi:MAG: hypothetical protein K8S55_09515, partial [Phycisphaerae bacterium]|nr:hypothetical protein [Phycisphaerae bacterium]
MTTSQIQHLESLKFFLFTRALHPELFEIRDDIRITKDAYEAQIWITGCSHVIAFYRGDAALTEVVADRNTPLPTHGRCLEIPFRGEKKHERKQFSGIDYM